MRNTSHHKARTTRSQKILRNGHRRCRQHSRGLFFEQLESRKLLATVTQLDSFSITGNVGEKPESKVWEHDNTWFNVVGDSSGTYVQRLDGTSWTQVLDLPSSAPSPAKADVKVVGDVAHILLENNSTSKLASIQYVPGSPGTYEMWDGRPNLASVSLASSVEAATIDIDSTGRMWVAYDNNSTKIQVRYSDSPYSSWSSPITLASNVKSDDISVITAMPDNTIGVLWSNQQTDRFGFRVHVDGASPQSWSADEVPASQSAQNVRGGMADDHLNVAVASDGTLYAAVKTSYDTRGYPQVGLLVRRPNGDWDDLHNIDENGTRPILQLNEATNQLIYTYEDGPFFYRECSAATIACGPRRTLIDFGKNASSTKQNVSDDLVIIISGKGSSGTVRGARLTFGAPSNQPPTVNAGPNQTIFEQQAANLNGTVTDDGLPNPPGAVTTQWSKVSGPGDVNFADASQVDTSATFSATGAYVLRLTADDSDRVRTDEVTITVNATPTNQPPSVVAGPDQTIFLNQVATLDGTVTDDGLPIPPGAFTAQWSVVSGPGSVSFGSTAAVDTSATFSELGQYVLRLTADDSELTSNDELTITVNSPPPNLPPVVNAGPDHTTSLSGVVTLPGLVTDDGLPDPPGTVSAAWSQLSGPGTATFVDANSAATVVSFDQVGTYVLRLTGNDGEATTIDTAAVNVVADPPTQTVTFQDGVAGYAGTRDTKIRSDLVSRNFGSSTRLEVDGNPDFASLLKWDVSAIPSNTEVVAASVTLDVTNSSTASFQFYQLLRPWVESSATYGQAAAGDSWQVPGAQGPADRGSVVLANITAPAGGTVTVPLTPAGVAAVQSWVANPASNYGAVVQNYDNAATDDLDFLSREASFAGSRPKLSVTYSTTPSMNLAINDMTIDENAGTADFLVSLNMVASEDVGFDFATADASAQSGSDYVAASGHKLIAAGSTSTSITVNLMDDTLEEDIESFQVNLSNSTNAEIADGTGIATIMDDDTSLTISDAVVDESAGVATFTVTLSEPEDVDVSFVFHTVDGSASTPSDYSGVTGNRTIFAGSTTATISVSIVDDNTDENDETFTVVLSNVTNSNIADGTGLGTIQDNDGLPELSIDDVTVSEGAGTAVFAVHLSAAIGVDVHFDFATSDIDADSATDYDASSGTRTIAAGSTSTTVSVAIHDDSLQEDDEMFEVTLSNAVNAAIAVGTANGTITDNDAPAGPPQTVAFQDGAFPTAAYSGTRDTKIRADFPDRRFTSSSKLEIDGRPDIASLLMWDISTISPGSNVVSAAITINVTNTSSDEFQLYEALQSWTDSEATFNEFRGGQPWQVAGAQGSNDRGSDVLATMTAPQKGSATFQLNSLGVAVVQGWIDNPSTNRGFVFQNYLDAHTDDLDFSSRDVSTPTLRPKLTVHFAAAAASSELQANLAADQVLSSQGSGAVGAAALEAPWLPSATFVVGSWSAADIAEPISAVAELRPVAPSDGGRVGNPQETALRRPARSPVSPLPQLEVSLVTISEDLLADTHLGTATGRQLLDAAFASWPE